ncbi:MAG: hypothetical protein EPN86_05665 [Nanoarchaeota archaeon]|nr:MAG: hypothetical protein EPN86_05665 [Nanoarchaeota archaeon]
MKKVSIFVFVMLVSIASAMAVSQMDAPGTLGLGSSTARSATQVSTQFTITNTGNDTISSITYATSTDPKYQIQLLNLPASLAPNESASVTLQGFIPNGFAGQLSIGQVQIRSAQLTKTIPITLQARNPLSIKKIAFNIDGSSDSVKDGETVDIKARPGSKITITITFENLFDKRTENIDINDVTADVTALDIDDGSDFDDSFDFDLNAGQKKEEKFSFTVPLTVDEGNYDFTVDAEGVDDNGVTQRASATVSYDVEKQNHDVRVTKFQIAPSVVDCSPRTIIMSTQFTNYGSNDEDQVSFGIRQPVLGIEINQLGISLSNDLGSTDSKFQRDIRYTIPDSVRPGTYQVELSAFTDSNLAAFQTADVTVNSCGEQNNSVAPPVIVNPPPTSTGTSGMTTAEPSSPTSTGVGMNTTLIIALAAINIVLLIVIIAVAGKLLSR